MERNIISIVKRKKPNKTIIQVRLPVATLDIIQGRAEEEGVATAEMCARIIQADVDREGRDPQFDKILSELKKLGKK